MPKHTPGPWKVSDDVDETVWVSAKAQDNVICDIVGRIWDFEAKTSQITDEDIANARLIAAAPEMLEALENIVWSLDHLDDIDIRNQKESILNAIAKAKGETTNGK